MESLRYKTIFLDWNGTLSLSKFWGHLERSNQTDQELFHKIENVLFGQMRPLLYPWMRGKYTSEDICEIVAKQTELPFVFILNEFVKSCRLMELSDEKIPDLLKRIKNAGLKVVIATDNMDSFDRWTYPALVERYGNIFDDVLNSFHLGTLKGDTNGDSSLFFDNYLQAQYLSYKDCILVDDSPDKNGIFTKIGLDYFQITGPAELIKFLTTLKVS